MKPTQNFQNATPGTTNDAPQLQGRALGHKTKVIGSSMNNQGMPNLNMQGQFLQSNNLQQFGQYANQGMGYINPSSQGSFMPTNQGFNPHQQIMNPSSSLNFNQSNFNSQQQQLLFLQQQQVMLQNYSAQMVGNAPQQMQMQMNSDPNKFGIFNMNDFNLLAQNFVNPGPIYSNEQKIFLSKLSEATQKKVITYNLDPFFIYILANYYRADLSKTINQKSCDDFKSAEQVYHTFIEIQILAGNPDHSFEHFKTYIMSISDPEDFKKVFVTNLPNKFGSKELNDLFSKYGKIQRALRAQPKLKKVEPYGYITFVDPKDAQKVINLQKVPTSKRPILVHSFTSNNIIKLFQKLEREPKRKNINSAVQNQRRLESKNMKILQRMRKELLKTNKLQQNTSDTTHTEDSGKMFLDGNLSNNEQQNTANYINRYQQQLLQEHSQLQQELQSQQKQSQQEPIQVQRNHSGENQIHKKTHVNSEHLEKKSQNQGFNDISSQVIPRNMQKKQSPQEQNFNSRMNNKLKGKKDQDLQIQAGDEQNGHSMRPVNQNYWISHSPQFLHTDLSLRYNLGGVKVEFPEHQSSISQ